MAHRKSQDQMTEIWSYSELIKGSQNWHIVGSLRGAGPLPPQVIIMLPKKKDRDFSVIFWCFSSRLWVFSSNSHPAFLWPVGSWWWENGGSSKGTDKLELVGSLAIGCPGAWCIQTHSLLACNLQALSFLWAQGWFQLRRLLELKTFFPGPQSWGVAWQGLDAAGVDTVNSPPGAHTPGLLCNLSCDSCHKGFYDVKGSVFIPGSHIHIQILDLQVARYMLGSLWKQTLF